MNTKTPLFFGSMVVVMLLVAGSIWLQLPTWVTPMVVAALAAGFGIFTYLRALNRPLLLETQPDPTDQARLQAALSATGRNDLDPAVGRQQEGVQLRVRHGRLYIAPRLLHLLSDRELNALVQVTAGAAANRVKAITRWYHGPWLATLALMVLVTPWFPPSVTFLGLAGIAYALSSQAKAVQAWMTRREFRALAEERVDLPALITARAKLYAELYRCAQMAPANAYQARAALETVAGELQVDRQELEQAFMAPLEEFALRWPDKQPPSPNDRLLKRLGIWLAIMAVSVIVALLLNGNQ